MTRNTNSYRFKGRAVLLAAIMVISMLAMPVAFTGVAAADLGDGDDSDFTFNDAEDLTAGASADHQNVSFTANLTGLDESTITIDYENVSDLDDDAEVIGADATSNEEDNVSVDDVSFNEDSVDVTLGNQSTSSVTENARIDVSVAVALDDVEPEQEIYLNFTAEDGDEIAGELGEDEAFDIRGTNVSDTNRAYEGQFVDTTNATDDEEVELVGDDSGFVDVKNAEDGFVFFDTESLDLETGDDYELINESGDVIGSWDHTTNRYTAEWSDDEVEDAGDTTADAEIDANRGTYTIYVTEDELESEVFDIFEDNQDLEDNIVETEDGALLFEIGDDDYEANFEDIDTDEYDFEFDMVDTVATASSSITVTDGDDDDLAFADTSPEVTQGDVAEIEIDNVAGEDEGFLVIGEFEDDGYEAVLNITEAEDEDDFTIDFNTYLAGNDTASGYGEIADSDDVEIELQDADNQRDISGILDEGDYDLHLATSPVNASDEDSVEDFIDNADEVGSLFVEERTVGDMTLWTATTDNAEDLEDGDDVSDAIDEDLLTETDTIAYGDALVHQIEIDGVGGFLEGVSEDDEDLEDDFLEIVQDEEVVNLNIEQTDDSAPSNREGTAVNTSDLDADDIGVIYEGGELYLTINSLDDDLDWTERDPSDEDEFTSELEIVDERLIEEGDDETPYIQLDEDDWDDDALAIGGEDEFEGQDPEAEFINLNDDDEIEVEAGEDQEITGETNLAPGTEFDIRTRGSGDARFVKTERDLVVNTDGEFVGEFDFSDRNVDEEFEASTRGEGDRRIDETAEEDGIIVESIDEEPADDEEEPVDDEEEPVDDEEEVDDEEVDDEEVDDEEVDDETDDETPGFGALVALVSLLGAALLAARRQN